MWRACRSLARCFFILAAIQIGWVIVAYRKSGTKSQTVHEQVTNLVLSLDIPQEVDGSYWSRSIGSEEDQSSDTEAEDDTTEVLPNDPTSESKMSEQTEDAPSTRIAAGGTKATNVMVGAKPAAQEDKGEPVQEVKSEEQVESPNEGEAASASSSANAPGVEEEEDTVPWQDIPDDDEQHFLKFSEAAFESPYKPRRIMESTDAENKRWAPFDGGSIQRVYPPEPPSGSPYETTWQCMGVSGFNMTCLFKHVYLVPHQTGVTLHVVGNGFVPHMRLATYGGTKFGDGKLPSVIRWKTRADLDKNMSDPYKLVRIKPLVLNVKVRYHFNWAHTCFDGLYASFVGAAKFHRHRDPFIIFMDSHNFMPPKTQCAECRKPPKGPWYRHDNCKGWDHATIICRMRETFRLFSSIGDKNAEYFRWQPARRTDKIFIFDEMIVGSQSHGQKLSGVSLSAGLASSFLPGERGVLPIFRQRLYWSYGYDPPWRRSSMDGRRKTPLQAYIADNKRFIEKKNILFKLEQLYKSGCSRVVVKYIHWGEYPTWKAQMSFIASADIFLTSIGTAQYYHMLLADGAVTVNLGHVEGQLNRLPTFGEEHLLASNPRARVLYLPPSVVRRGPTLAEYVDILEQAVDLIHSNFPIPVADPHRHLSIYAQIIQDYIEKDPFFGAILSYSKIDQIQPGTGVKVTPKHTHDCPKKYPANLVYEIVKVRPNCYMQFDILREIKKKYNLDKVLHSFDSVCPCVVCLDCPGNFTPPPRPEREFEQCNGHVATKSA